MSLEEKQLEVPGGSLIWREMRRKVTILGIKGNMTRLEVPGEIEGFPVTEIYKKAFFNCRYLRFVSLPGTLEEIGGWAFAHCPQLIRVEIPCKPMRMGRDPFIGSDALREIALVPQKADTAAMLAMAATKMEDPHLFNIEEAGTSDWMKRWDARMLVLLRETDSVGFEKQILAGEEDCVSTDFERFTREKRRAKVRFAFLRLLHSDGLSDEVRKELEEYLREHTKGCDTEETWQVLLTEFGEEKEYYELFAKLGCVTQDNFDLILQDIREGLPEMKAYFMKYKEEHLGYTDFFDSLSLDF
ncbi:MAG: leucine-rich repeat protein [Lachnospiraceae bacterium]|nr:leucine-rich repeat protein [Lachnospiraceae bacterium]